MSQEEKDSFHLQRRTTKLDLHPVAIATATLWLLYENVRKGSSYSGRNKHDIDEIEILWTSYKSRLNRLTRSLEKYISACIVLTFWARRILPRLLIEL